MVDTDFDYLYGKETDILDEEDKIVLQQDDPTAKWPISFALAQSVKLESFEKSVKETFSNMKDISHTLARKGQIPLTPKEIVCEMGTIMELLVNVNLGETDFTSDLPDEFWEDAHSADTWKIFNNYLSVKNRVKVLDSQLKMFKEFYVMLSEEVHVKKSTRLEWAIIWLISIEVAFGLTDRAHWFSFLTAPWTG